MLAACSQERYPTTQMPEARPSVIDDATAAPWDIAPTKDFRIDDGTTAHDASHSQDVGKFF